MATYSQNIRKFPASKAVCLLVHGLNNTPEVLKDLSDLLESFSIPVISIGLTGHVKDADKLKTITRPAWENDVLSAYQEAKEKYEKIYFVGYSLGAAIGLDILSEEVKFDKMVLLAPAIAPRALVKLLKYVAPLWPSLPLFSLTPPSYRSNPYLPLKTYAVLFEIYQSLKKKKFAHANLPALVVMDPKDETMDLNKIKLTKYKCGLNRWEIFILNSEEAKKNIPFHHLIVDKKGMGMQNWEAFTSRLQDFLREQ